jgi:hypothetical protein
MIACRAHRIIGATGAAGHCTSLCRSFGHSIDDQAGTGEDSADSAQQGNEADRKKLA